MNIIEKGNIIEQVFNTVNAATVAIKEKGKVEEEKLDDIQVVEIKGVRYLTSAILAERYGTTPKRIANNFNENKERYKEGKHFIKLTGDELKAFFAVTNFGIANQSKIRTLYLWTEHGAFLHAKSLNTDKAWEAYEKLIEVYFRAQKAQTALQNLSPQLQLMIRIETEQNALKAKVADIEQRLDNMTVEPDPEPTKALPKKWSERETDYLRKAYALGQTDTEIAADLGRTVDSIKNKRRALGLCDDSKCKRHWRPAEDKKLKKYYNQGISAYDIGQLLGRSLESVEGRLHRLRKAGRL